MLYLNENKDVHLLRLDFELMAQLWCVIMLMGHYARKFTEHKLQQKLRR